jgi:hypothetical protein
LANGVLPERRHCPPCEMVYSFTLTPEGTALKPLKFRDNPLKSK